MIKINENKISFDLMKEIPEKMRNDFNLKWRNMDASFINNFLIEWKSLPQNRVNIELPKEDYNEVIVKDIYGRDIFSFEINKDVLVMISQYEGYWNILFTNSNKKIIIFTA